MDTATVSMKGNKSFKTLRKLSPHARPCVMQNSRCQDRGILEHTMSSLSVEINSPALPSSLFAFS